MSNLLASNGPKVVTYTMDKGDILNPTYERLLIGDSITDKTSLRILSFNLNLGSRMEGHMRG